MLNAAFSKLKKLPGLKLLQIFILRSPSQPDVHKNSKDPAILISELDDVMVTTHMGRYTLIN